MNTVELIEQSDEKIKQVVTAIGSADLDPVVSEHLLDWLVFLKVLRNLSASTVRNYGAAMLDFCLFLNELDDDNTGETGVWIFDAKPIHLDEWHKTLALSKMKPATRSMRLSGVRQFYKWADYREFCIDRMHTVVGPKTEDKVPKVYSEKQLQEFFRSCDRNKPMGIRDFAVLMMFLGTGARRMEVETLRLSQLELNTNVGVVLFSGKGAKERTVAFEKPLVDALRAWLHVRDQYNCDHDFVFCGLNGKSIGEPLARSGLDGIIDRVAKCSGNISEGLHRLRSVFATQLYEQTRDIELVRVTLGHNDINTTRRYIAISPSARVTRMSSATLRNLTGLDREQTRLPRWMQQQKS